MRRDQGGETRQRVWYPPFPTPCSTKHRLVQTKWTLHSCQSTGDDSLETHTCCFFSATISTFMPRNGQKIHKQTTTSIKEYEHEYIAANAKSHKFAIERHISNYGNIATLLWFMHKQLLVFLLNSDCLIHFSKRALQMGHIKSRVVSLKRK